jgi:hypothetical protein
VFDREKEHEAARRCPRIGKAELAITAALATFLIDRRVRKIA